MPVLTLPNAPSAPRAWAPLAVALALVLGAALLAQVGGDRGIIPVASSEDIEVRDIRVNVSGKNPDDARLKGWEAARKLAWQKLGGPAIPDSQLQGLVSAIVVQQERLGPRRYIATLGVIFDRARAGGLLGRGGARSRSAPMLTLPVLIAGGTQTLFEVRTEWQRAWAESQMGGSAIDYVRPSGAGGESLLLTYGQTNRRSRAWWNDILDQFGAADVLIPIARLTYAYPGGPVEGHFTARYGPDSKYLGQFTLRVNNAAGLPAMFERAVQRFDQLYTRALLQGLLRPDPTLSLGSVEISPAIRALIEAARRAEEAAAGANEVVPGEVDADAPTPTPTPDAPQALGTFTVQVATPDGRAFDAALGSIRGAAGVRGVAVSSTAVGGTSVLRVTYLGDIGGLAAALRAAGWNVNQGSSALAISR